jgi:hypothetical protein
MNYQSDDLSDELVKTNPVSQADLTELTKTLQQLVKKSSPNIDAALQPTVIVLNKLVTAHQSLREELLQQQEIIKKQSIEIKELKKQSQDHSSWLSAHINRKTISIFSLAAAVILATLLTGFQKLLPVTIDSEAIDKLNFLYFQELKRYEKSRTNSKK